MTLSGKVVAITGAASGIGAATARACAAQGAAVVLGARREDRLRELAASIEQGGGRALAVPTDVSDERQAARFVQAAIDQLGRLDALVNNAGVMFLGPIAGAPIDEWRRMIDVNLLGVLYCTHAALPHLLEHGGGDIVFVSSVAGRNARAGGGVYCMTKFGVNAFSEALRQEVTAQGVRVTVVEPGVVETELASHNRAEVRARMAEMFQGIEPLDPAHVADGIVYAISRPAGVSVNEVLVRPTSQVP